MSTERDKDARAAMSAIVRAGSAARWNGTGVGEGTTFSWPAADDVVRFATVVADAMEAERTRRAGAPADPFFIGAAVTCDCGAPNFCEPGRVGEVVAIDKDDPRSVDMRYRGSTTYHRTDKARLFTGRTPPDWRDDTPPSPDLASLQAENAKLRAVAEAAATLALWGGVPRVPQWQPLVNALDAALPGWRTTKETP